MKTMFTTLTALALCASGAALADERAIDRQDVAKAPIELSEAQMDQVVAGKYTLDPIGNSDSSCNSGKCSYQNPQGETTGKPVKGYNN